MAPSSLSAGPRADGELSLLELLQLVHRRRWLLLVGLLLGGLGGIGVVALVSPVYVAQALLIIEPDRAGRGGPTVASASDTLDSASVDSQVEILTSRSLARQVIAQLHLETDPDLTARPRAGLLRLLLGETTSDAAAHGDLVGRFLDRLAVKREGKSHVIKIAYRSGDPVRAAEVANKLAELYMVGQLSRKFDASRRQSGWLQERLAALKGRLDASEAELARFRAASGPVLGEGFAADPGEIAGLNGQLVAVTAERAGKEAVLDRLRRLVAGDGPVSTLGELGSSPLLDHLTALKADLLRREAELAAQYGERHPKIVDIRAEKAKLEARLQQERQALLRQFEGEVDRSRAKERALARQLEELKSKALQREQAVQRIRELERAVELDRRLYEDHLARASAEEVPETIRAPDARLISEAVAPTEPSFPKPKLVLSLSLTGGLLLGIAAMYLAEAGERGFRSARDVEEVLGLPVLALVPKLDTRRSGLPPQDYLLERPRSRYAEALRELLASPLLRRPAGAGGKVVLVTSSLPREGKSTLVLSLARAAAAEGLRVLAIDADLRKPSLHALAGLKAGAGLVEVLRREVPLAEVAAVDPKAPVRLLPGSQRLSQPTRLLGPEGLGALLMGLRPNFDLVLIDSAPLVAVADPKLIADLVDAVLLVVRYADTRREFCRACLQSLIDIGAKPAGVVLTQTDQRRHARSAAHDAGVAAARLGGYYRD
ncbi:GumC family protein [Benzoatithermus flavus]|uniref:Wzz/FepE/Etk N-terminal domain-containing protein n=1 Tax=Benzoatithermus flavus TaxID=3108223 RepID=A0ABU8XML3_9PROT